MKAFPLNFPLVAASLAHVHCIEVGKMRAFESRLKNLQRLGFLPDINTGRGRPAAYGVDETLLLALAVELLQLGATPERVISVLNPRIGAIVHELKTVVGNRGIFDRSSVLMYFDPRALNDLQDLKELHAREQTPLENVTFGSGSDLGTYFKRHLTASARLAVIDLRRMLADLLVSIGLISEINQADIVDDLVEWAFA